jgi:hypothetical protein
MTSICLVYPDGWWLNSEDYYSRVDVQTVGAAESEFARYQGRGIALAAPEVSLDVRHQLLQMGSQYGFYRVLALNSAETRSTQAEQMLEGTDLLAINLDEAAAFAGLEDSASPERIVSKAIDRMRLIRDGLCARSPPESWQLGLGWGELNYAPALLS